MKEKKVTITIYQGNTYSGEKAGFYIDPESDTKELMFRDSGGIITYLYDALPLLEESQVEEVEKSGSDKVDSEFILRFAKVMKAEPKDVAKI